MNFEDPYLTKQIIAYIGNKRKLLNLIYKAINSIYHEIPEGLKFLDLFSGSGIVSRFAKYLNFEVFSNDWEEYSYIINNAYLRINRKDINKLFGSINEFEKLLEDLNNLEDPPLTKQYIAKYYAPTSFDIDEADFRKERLFYTRYNALTIDKIRNKINELFPAADKTEKNIKKRHLLISLLIYEAATHTNTSGVFKACHKGFGGHNKDALTRILSPIRLRKPVLIDSKYKCHVYKEDANALMKNEELSNIDIVYLDPPYNQHQYGSNYHMLNTVALWDKIPAPLSLNDKGRLKEKAAIRKDWVKTRSKYCYKDEAAETFKELMANIKAKYILISYSTDGIIPFENMKEICSSKGRLSIETNEYTKYRGGKQSNNRLNTNIEFILIIDTQKKSTSVSLKKIDEVIKRKATSLLFKKRYSEKKLKQEFQLFEQEGVLETTLNGMVLRIYSNDFFELLLPENIMKFDLKDLDILNTKLSNCVCSNKEEEINEILNKIDGNSKINYYFIKLLPDTLKKIAHKKNKDKYYYWLGKIKSIKKRHEELYLIIGDKITAIEELAEKRFKN